MNFQSETNVIAVKLDFHIADREIVLPFEELAIRSWKVSGEPGAQFICYANGEKIAQGECVAPRVAPQISTFYPDMTYIAKKGTQLKFQFSKVMIDKTKSPDDHSNLRDPRPAITVTLECTAIMEEGKAQAQ